MSDNKVRKWMRMLKDGRVHNEPRPDRTSLISEDLIPIRDSYNKIREYRRNTILQLAIDFPQVSRSVF